MKLKKAYPEELFVVPAASPALDRKAARKSSPLVSAFNWTVPLDPPSEPFRTTVPDESLIAEVPETGGSLTSMVPELLKACGLAVSLDATVPSLL